MLFNEGTLLKSVSTKLLDLVERLPDAGGRSQKRGSSARAHDRGVHAQRTQKALAARRTWRRRCGAMRGSYAVLRRGHARPTRLPPPPQTPSVQQLQKTETKEIEI